MSTVSLGNMAIVSPMPRPSNQFRTPIGSIPQPGSPPGGIIAQPLCHNTTRGTPSLIIQAGEYLNLQFTRNGLAKGGGHCQFAISYDNKKFVVIEDKLKYCFKRAPSNDDFVSVYNYDIELPEELPTGYATLAWTWVNAIGAREYYMGCVDILIQGGHGNWLTGPELLVVNHPTLGGGVVIPEFKGNYNTGLELFKQRPIITVSPDNSNPNRNIYGGGNRNSKCATTDVGGSGSINTGYSVFNNSVKTLAAAAAAAAAAAVSQPQQQPQQSSSSPPPLPPTAPYPARDPVSPLPVTPSIPPKLPSYTPSPSFVPPTPVPAKQPPQTATSYTVFY
ncbi:hypothetical protein H4219_004262 [Mycoemilia scoparia]|uniref:Chitin-binding type-4 domain-containing protein n=1 Tax=Mycoemilia scoparia TaxID=417184 RepID=A0A9W8DRP1_9FUNG|nr:hypothetical protein H4219_004262 [Mycoemilia scoparia]